MKEKKETDTVPLKGLEETMKEFEEAISNSRGEKYILTLYVSGMTDKSLRAIKNVRSLCEEYLKDRYELNIVDIYQQSEIAFKDQIIATPTLLKKLPPPLRTFIGDMSKTEHMLVGLNITKSK